MKIRTVCKVSFLTVLLILSVLFLQGCDLLLSPEVYVSDLIDLKEGTSTLISVPTIIKLQVISKDSYTENRDRITMILQDYFGRVSRVSYEEDGFNSYYVAQVNLPVVKDQKLEKGLSYAMFLINVLEDKEGIKLALIFNSTIFNSLKDRVFKEFSQTISVDEIALDINLVNDLKNDVTLEAQGVYLDKYPCPFRSRYVLGRREKVNIAFSNVLRDYLIKSGSAEFAYLIIKQ
ncbi:MAG: hypothetical protein N2511_07790, partial [Thermodesulfovibrionales bacterium]|nr:hypothetical protein [Thermodesulfovibrionales bacterium]